MINLDSNVCIPKIIFQTWKTHNVPEKWKTSPESIKAYMPTWTYVLFDDNENEEFVEKNFPEYILFYKSLRFPIQKADFIRYCFLYVNGGVYSDLDIEFVAPIDNLFLRNRKEGEEEDKVFLLKAPQNFAGHFTNFFMASTAKNAFWLTVLRECVEPLPPWVILPHNIISEQTGLACLSRAVKKAKESTGIIIVLPFQNLVPCDVCSPPADSDSKKPYYYTKFLKGQSWNGIDTHFFNAILCNRLEILFFAAFLAFILLKKIFL
jgi:mannosyltransferase OCH1-like enzyme